MADLTFDRAQEKLTWHSRTLTWKAVTGPHGAGMLPTGLYDIERRKITAFTSSIETPYQDDSGSGFFLPITPTFTTSRSGFGIHPDGNVSGTLGCIGLTAPSTKDFYDTVALTSPSAKLTLQVK